MRDPSSSRLRRLLAVGAGGLLLTLLALGVAAWALLRADVRRSRDRADDRVRQIVSAVARVVAADPDAAWVALDRDLRVVDPSPPRAFAPLPAATDVEGVFYLERAREAAVTGDRAREAAALGLAGASPDDVVRLGALVARARAGAAASDPVPDTLRDTRDGVFVGLVHGDAAWAIERALAVVGSPDEDVAAALLVGSAEADAAMGELIRARRAALRDAARVAAMVASAAPPAPSGDGARVLVDVEGALLVAVTERPLTLGAASTTPGAALWATTRPPGALRDVVALLADPEWSVIGPRDAVGGESAPLPGSGGYRVVVHESATGRLLVVSGFCVAAAAAAFAFAAFARGVTREARLARLRTQFVVTVSHELRTPVAVVRSAAEALALGRAKRPEDQQRLVAAIVTESERLSALLGNVLDFARLEAGRRRFSFEDGDVAVTVCDAVDALRPALDRLGVEASVATPDGGVMAIHDRAAVGAAVSNLVDNAAKFAGGKIAIAVERAPGGGDVVVSVIDHGPGVPVAERQRVFERFTRGASAAVQEQRGTGIGLALVRSAVEAHGGAVSIVDTPGGGATFRMRIPLSARGRSPMRGSG